MRGDLCGPAGILQGDITATLVDVAATSTAAISGTDLVATTEMTLHYLAPGRIGTDQSCGRASAERHPVVCSRGPRLRRGRKRATDSRLSGLRQSPGGGAERSQLITLFSRDSASSWPSTGDARRRKSHHPPHPKPQHLNHNDTVNAAVRYGLAEAAGAGAVVADMLDLAAQSYTVVKKPTIEYLAPARGVLEATGHVDGTAVEQAKDRVMAGNAIELDVPVRSGPRGLGGGRVRIHGGHPTEPEARVTRLTVPVVLLGLGSCTHAGQAPSRYSSRVPEHRRFCDPDAPQPSHWPARRLAL